MKVAVELLSTLHECLPDGAGTVELPDSTTLAGLIYHLGIDKKLGKTPDEIIKADSWMVMVNECTETNLEMVLHDGDCVKVFRWVAGG